MGSDINILYDWLSEEGDALRVHLQAGKGEKRLRRADLNCRRRRQSSADRKRIGNQRVHSRQRRQNRIGDIFNGFGHAFAGVSLLVSIAKLQRFVLARGSATRYGRAPERATVESDISFNGWVTAAVQNLPGFDLDYA